MSKDEPCDHDGLESWDGESEFSWFWLKKVK
jgi:hypothetical protein